MRLIPRLQTLSRREAHSFHYPGHKGRLEAFGLQDLLALDTTETFGTDNLLHPRDILRQTQEELGKIFGSLSTSIGVGGSTMALYASLYALCDEGDKIVVDRRVHKSIHQMARLLHLEVLSFSKEAPLRREMVQGAKAAVFVHPTYYGEGIDEKAFALAKEEGLLLLVDEAHGAHLPFFDRSRSALDLGADLVVQSAHKSLPSLTQTALLHRTSDRVSPEVLEEAVAMFSSTSPSYVFMASVEKAVDWMAHHGKEKLLLLEETIDTCYEALASMGVRRRDQVDPFKLVISIPGRTGEELYHRLYEDFGLAMEFYDMTSVVAVVTVADEPEDIEALTRACLAIGPGEADVPAPLSFSHVPEWQGLGRTREWVELDKALGRVASHSLVPYPPGIGLILPGEVYDERVLTTLREALSQGIVVEGVEGRRVEVFQ